MSGLGQWTSHREHAMNHEMVETCGRCRCDAWKGHLQYKATVRICCLTPQVPGPHFHSPWNPSWVLWQLVCLNLLCYNMVWYDCLLIKKLQEKGVCYFQANLLKQRRMPSV